MLLSFLNKRCSSLTRESIADIWNFNIVLFYVVAANFKDESSFIGFNLAFCHFLYDVAHCLRHPLSLLWLGHKEWVKHPDPSRKHCNLQSLIFQEVIEELFEGHFAIDLETIPQCPSLLIVLLHLCFCWFREGDKGQCDVDEAVLVSLDSSESMRNLLKFCNFKYFFTHSWVNLINSNATHPETIEVVVAMAGMILPAINLDWKYNSIKSI